MRMNMQLLPLFVLISTFLVGCKTGHTQEQNNNQNEPQVKIEVNKETDENGNVIRYDSTYSYSWSGSGNFDVDSVLKQFGFSSSWFGEQNDPFGSSFFDRSNFGFDVNAHFKEMEELQKRMMQRHHEMMKGFFEDQIVIPAPQDTTNSPPAQPTKMGRTYKI